MFYFSKNILRLDKEKNIFFGIQKIQNRYLKNLDYSNKYAKIYIPDVKNNSQNGWHGRLCWNIPFICSTENLIIYRKNDYLFLIK